jgi:hypothetical protein
MTEITSEHLAHSAFVYIRQSTADHLVHNKESQRRGRVRRRQTMQAAVNTNSCPANL